MSLYNDHFDMDLQKYTRSAPWYLDAKGKRQLSLPANSLSMWTQYICRRLLAEASMEWSGECQIGESPVFLGEYITSISETSRLNWLNNVFVCVFPLVTLLNR